MTDISSKFQKTMDKLDATIAILERIEAMLKELESRISNPLIEKPNLPRDRGYKIWRRAAWIIIN